ncbi:MAG: pirin family protein [Acidobacteria bacterium]|nr:pirin family protein [Acidobacteriota bacterium]
MTKQIKGIWRHGAAYWVGDGFEVRNMFPSNPIAQDVSPFLMLDYAGPTVFAPSPQPRGVGEHPHRGFETITIVYQGKVEHRDSTGSSGVIGPGDVQWMTAASGLVHEEIHEREFARQGGTFEIIQLWLNLPRIHKMAAPGYQTLINEDIPRVDGVRVIAGSHGGVRGLAHTFTPVTLLDIAAKAGETKTFSLEPGFNAALFLRKGSVSVNGTALAGEAQIAVLAGEGTDVEIAADSDSGLLLLAGDPIREPVAQQGPFVMNTQQELLEAIRDYRAGRMGHLTARV